MSTSKQLRTVVRSLAVMAAVAAIAWAVWTLSKGRTGGPTGAEESADAGPAAATSLPPDFPRPGSPGYGQPPAGLANAGAPPGARAMPGPTPATAARKIDTALFNSEIGRLRAALAAATDPRDRVRLIREFGDLVAAAVEQLGADAVANELVRLLRDNFVDVDFQLPFQPGHDGRMETVPNLRSLLLDGLAATASPVAAEFARSSVLDQRRTPEDWALGLKIIWEASEQNPGDAYLSGKVAEMLRAPEWTSQPSGALLESFDFVVAQHNKDLVPDMVQFLGGETGSGTPFAASIVLQRMAETDPSVALQVMDGTDRFGLDPDVAKSRATIVAKVDPTKPESLPVIRNYLSDTGVTREERAYFIATFPQLNEILTPNIASTQYPETRETQAARHVAALEIVKSWADDPSLTDYRGEIDAAIARLSEIIESAKRGGVL